MIAVNAAAPGCRPDMGGPDVPVAPEQAAEAVHHLASLPDGAPGGRLLQNAQVIDW